MFDSNEARLAGIEGSGIATVVPGEKPSIHVSFKAKMPADDMIGMFSPDEPIYYEGLIRDGNGRIRLGRVRVEATQADFLAQEVLLAGDEPIEWLE